MKIVITGGAGYVGNSLAIALNASQLVNEIVIYDNLSRGDFNFFFGRERLQKVRFVKGDILDSYHLESALTDADTLIHLAAHVAFPFNHLQNLQYEQINRWGTLAVVRAAEKIKSIKQVLYLSSTAVYGFGSDLETSSMPNPENAYGISKYEGENYMRLLADTKRLGIVRSANVFGYNNTLRLDSVINAFFFEALTTGQIKIYGNGSQQRAFVEINNLIDKISQWVFGKEFLQEEVAIDFNASLNDIKDWMLTAIPNLEYTYLNQNQDFSGQSFKGFYKPQLVEKYLKETFQDFSVNTRIDIP